jgi:hypothetical protein
MELNCDFSEFITFFFARNVKFLVVGGYAVAAHGHPRYTKDLDIWIRVDASNAENVVRALDDFGFGDLGLVVDDSLADDVVVQLGREPQRIDLLTFVSGVEFDDAHANRMMIEMSGVEVPVIGRADLRRNKLATGRLHDLADVEDLGWMSTLKDWTPTAGSRERCDADQWGSSDPRSNGLGGIE